MSLDHLNGVGTYNLVCGSRNTCPPKPDNPEALAYESAYDGWKASVSEGGFMVDLPNGSLIVGGPDPYLANKTRQSEVYSEGMAYGMFFAVQSGDRATFDKLLNGMENYARNENGLYSWRLSTKGEVLEAHSAADADLYAAAAVTLAFAKWGGQRYQQVAQRLINSIWEEEVLDYKGYHILLPSDGEWPRYKDGRFAFNPSHFAPSLLRVIAGADNNPKHNWNKVVNDGYQLLTAIISHSKELNPKGMNPIPDLVLGNVFEGKFSLEIYTAAADNEYDAIRVYLELARDAVVSRDPRAVATADQIMKAFPFKPTPDTARIDRYTNEISSAYYGLLYLASSQPAAAAKSFISRLQPSYHNKFIGSAEADRKSYYFQSLLLHATSLLGGYTFDPPALRQFGATPAAGYEDYIPFRISAREDGSVYIRNVLIYKYDAALGGLSPHQRAQKSALAIKQAYLDGRLRPKYLGKVSDREMGSMITNYGTRPFNTHFPLFELGPEDLAHSSGEQIGFRWTTGAYRRLNGWLCNNLDLFCGSISYREVLPSQGESFQSWYADQLGFKSRKSRLEVKWDDSYNQIYLNLIRSRIIDPRKEADRKLNDLTTLEKAGNRLIDFYALTNAARSREVAEYSRAFDDVVSISKFISSFLHKNPLTGFARPTSYYETLFSLANILADQDRRYRVSLVQDQLVQIEHDVRCREKRIPTGKCNDSPSGLPIDGLSKSEDYLEAASKIIETIVQSDINNFGYKARALREKADLSFRMMEKGEGVSETALLSAPPAKMIVGDYLTALELWKDRFNLSGAENMRQHPIHKEIMQKLEDTNNFYGLAEKYTSTRFKPQKMFLFDYGDVFEVAKLAIHMGNFYLFTHGQEERYELPHYNETKYKGLKEAEIWFRFVAQDPHGIFSDNTLKAYRIEAQLNLAVTQMQLGYLELDRGKKAEAGDFFDRALLNAGEAYDKVKVEINRMPSEDWANDGVSMNLRNIYFNILINHSVMLLNLAELEKSPANSRVLIQQANGLMQEALENKELIIFGSTKHAVYKNALRALLAEAESMPPEKMPVSRMVSILKIDVMTEKESLNLQVQALALLVYHCLKTTPNLQAAESKLTKLLPARKINYRIRRRLQAEDTGIRNLMNGLLRENFVPQAVRKEFAARVKQ